MWKNIKQTSAGKETAKVEELSPSETKDRIIALCLVFAVVIFFWMAFHQNGLTLTYFADEFTAKSFNRIGKYDVRRMESGCYNLYRLWFIFLIPVFYRKRKSDIRYRHFTRIAFLGYRYSSLNGSVPVDAPIFQQFNPFFVVALTPVPWPFSVHYPERARNRRLHVKSASACWWQHADSY